MGNCVPAPGQLPIRFFRHGVWRQLVDDLALRLVCCIEDREVNLSIAGDASQRLRALAGGLLEHAIKSGFNVPVQRG